MKLCFLDGCDGDALGVEKVTEIVGFALDSVAIPLKESRTRRRKRTRRRRR